ncbi:hypothetical protein WR25_24466 [Diploscapter pachys]|uniref:F-box domain-containing protein n=1 Tax=Diploscapter pachys TaxID=2018661 RepID=A0A2A2LJQ6_9BILA|nr:hypothetical protein WR25_24466 [Diploscapter pachys]
MILDVLPLELMREVLLDLPTVDIIQTVKCTRRLHYFATEKDKALGRRLQNCIILSGRLCIGSIFCWKCGNPVLCLYLGTKFFRANDAATQWNHNSFDFWFEGGCKCWHINGPKIEPDLLNHPSSFYESHLLKGFENRTNFVINNGSLDDAVINCGKLFNILTKFSIVRVFRLELDSSDGHIWDKMNPFFNANPPDLRIQSYVSICNVDSEIKLDSFSAGSIFSNGLVEISIRSRFKPILVNAYHEVFRRTPNVFFSGITLPYTYEDLFGFFKDTKELTLGSVTRITKQQLCQLVQNFYEVKHDEECFFKIGIEEDFLVKDLLTLIPEEAYSLHLKRSGDIGPEPEMMIWAEMTDRFGGRWGLMDITVYELGIVRDENLLIICSMKYFNEDSDQFDSDQSDSYQSDSDQSDSDSDQL